MLAAAVANKSCVTCRAVISAACDADAESAKPTANPHEIRRVQTFITTMFASLPAPQLNTDTPHVQGAWALWIIRVL